MSTCCIKGDKQYFGFLWPQNARLGFIDHLPLWDNAITNINKGLQGESLCGDSDKWRCRNSMLPPLTILEPRGSGGWTQSPRKQMTSQTAPKEKIKWTVFLCLSLFSVFRRVSFGSSSSCHTDISLFQTLKTGASSGRLLPFYHRPYTHKPRCWHVRTPENARLKIVFGWAERRRIWVYTAITLFTAPAPPPHFCPRETKSSGQSGASRVGQERDGASGWPPSPRGARHCSVPGGGGGGGSRRLLGVFAAALGFREMKLSLSVGLPEWRNPALGNPRRCPENLQGGNLSYAIKTHSSQEKWVRLTGVNWRWLQRWQSAPHTTRARTCGHWKGLETWVYRWIRGTFHL